VIAEQRQRAEAAERELSNERAQNKLLLEQVESLTKQLDGTWIQWLCIALDCLVE